MRDSVKLVAAIAILLIAGGLIAAFASGYISAFKPGGKRDASQSASYSGSYGGGGSVMGRAAPPATPSPTPPQMPPSMGEGPQAPASMPTPPSPAQPGTALQPMAQPGAPYLPQAGPVSPEEQYATPGQIPASFSGLQPGSWPDDRAIARNPATSPSPQPQAPVSGQDNPWFNAPIAQDRPLPSPSPPPVPQVIPGEGRTVPQLEQPGVPNVPYMPLTPYQAGWMQVFQRLMDLLPLLFPNMAPVQPWWPQTA